jgi:DNA polymerase III epsilon subunit-like protein
MSSGVKRSLDVDDGGKNFNVKKNRNGYGQDTPYNVRGPAQRPYQADDHVGDASSVKLDFNYWANTGCILPKDITNLIMSVLQGGNIHTPAYLHQGGLDNISSVYIFAIHGLDVDTLADGLLNLPFLSKCSTMPIRHTAYASQSPTFNDISGSRLWKFYEVQSMTAMIAWPERVSLSSDEIGVKDPFTLFTSYSLIFRGLHTSWNDSLNFTADDSVTGAYLAIINKYISSTSLEANTTDVSRLLPVVNEGGHRLVIGRFKRISVNESGVFMLKESNEGGYDLVLAWFKWDPEVVVVDTDEKRLTFTDNNKLRLIIDKAYLNDKEIPSVTGNKEGKIVESASALAESTNQWDVIKSLYERTKGKLQSLVLSIDMMNLMGYVNESTAMAYVYNNDGIRVGETEEIISTNTFGTVDETWRMRQTCMEPEEGEEEEDDEMIGTEVEVMDSPPKLDICALDCEMVTTSAGHELVRITIVSPTVGVVYDTLVQPSLPVLNYNTEFSGVKKEMLDGVTITLHDVHQKLRQLLSADTFIVGHSLDNDLKALKLHHAKIIDTVALYPHPKGLPMKLSLKSLAEQVLKRSIRNDEGAGHDSAEDAYIALELALHKATGSYDDKLLYVPCTLSSETQVSLFDQIASKGNSVVAECSLHACKLNGAVEDWEEFGKGFRPESNILNALRFSAAQDRLQSVLFKSASHIDCFTCLEAAMQEIKGATDERQSSSTEPRLNKVMWIDMPCDFRQGAIGWATLESIDDCLKQVHDMLPSGSLMLALSQGDIAHLKSLVSRKQFHRWDNARFFWDEVDEALLIETAAKCLAGAIFLRIKQ